MRHVHAGRAARQDRPRVRYVGLPLPPRSLRRPLQAGAVRGKPSVRPPDVRRPVDASNDAATLGANSIYWFENEADKVRGKLEKCGMVQNVNYGRYGLAAAEIECRSESGVTYRIPQYRATLRFYSCGAAEEPAR